MEKLVSKKLPEIEILQNQRRHQTEIKCQLVIEAVADDCLNGKNGDIGNQQEFNRWGDPARTEGDLSSLVLHVV